MKTEKKTKIVEWYSADRMHNMSKTWLSELNFIKDEQVFLEELLTDYTHKIVRAEILDRAKIVTTALLRTARGNQSLINDLTKQEKELSIMVDGKDEIEKEKQYKEDHIALTKTLSSFFYDYKAVKFEVFELVKRLMKTDKDEHLLN
jgi:hypothetical protein